MLLSVIVDQVCAGHSQSCIWGDCNAEGFRDSARALLLCREAWTTVDDRTSLVILKSLRSDEAFDQMIPPSFPKSISWVWDFL